MAENLFALSFLDVPDLQVEVLHFELHEAISQNYALNIVVHPLVAPLPVAHDALIDGRVALQIATDSGNRQVYGVIGRVELDYLESAVLRLTVAPKMQSLSIGRDSRIFQDMSAIDIVQELLKEHGVEHELRLVGSYLPRVYSVQYQESTLAFVQRLLADEGVFYFFEHGEDGPERLVLGDHPQAYSGSPEDCALSYRPESGGGMRTDQQAALRFWATNAMATSHVALTDYDFTRPATPWGGNADGSDSQGNGSSDGQLTARATGMREHYEHKPSHHHTDVLNSRATTALSQARRQAARRHGTTLARRLKSGHTLHMAEHPITALDGDYVVIQARHEGRGEALLTAQRYSMISSFQCVAADVAFRPPLPAPVIRQVVETARVVGPSVEAIFTDEHGRIKVQFHWDRDGQHNERSSCWMRTMQPWSGPSMGAQFIPRVGSEVLVTFGGGNIDQPVVLGGLHNPTNTPPFSLPDNRTASGIRSNALDGSGGYNELRFEDAVDGEKVTLHAHRDFDQEVGGDSDTVIGGSHTARVGSDVELSAGGKLSQSAAGNMTLNSAAERHDKVAARYTVEVGAELSTRVVSHLDTQIGGSLSEKVVGTVSRTVDGVSTTTARGGMFVNVGSATTPSLSTSFVHGRQIQGATESITLNAEQEIRLVCGETVLRLTPDELAITSAKVTINGTDETTVLGKDALVLLSGDAEVSAPNVNMISSGASVELNSNAELFGDQVRLNCDRGSDATSLSEDEEEPETQEFSVTCADALGEGYGGKEYVLLVDGVRYTGTTAGDGGVSEEIPKDAAHATLTVWIGDYPQGERRVYELSLGNLEGADTLAGARARLTNLGYRPGSGEELDDTTRDALERFQLDRDLEPSGELDDPTIAALNE